MDNLLALRYIWFSSPITCGIGLALEEFMLVGMLSHLPRITFFFPLIKFNPPSYVSIWWLKWQWKKQNFVDKCWIFSFKTTWLIQAHQEPFASKTGYFAFWTCRYISSKSCLLMRKLFWFSNHITSFNDILIFEEHYHHKLAGALAHCFESKLLSLDIAHFSLKVVIYILSLYLLWFVLYMLWYLSCFRFDRCRENTDVLEKNQ